MTLTQITEKGIKDGEIVNADISSNTADRISGSKITPNFGGQAISTTGYLDCANQLTIGGTEPRLVFTDGDNNPDFTLWANGGNFKIYDTTNTTARLHVNSSGNIGIGTETQSARLHVTNSTGNIGYFESTQAAVNAPNLILNSTQTDSSANLEFQINGGTTANGIIRLNGDNSIDFHNGATPTFKARLNSSGYLGLGTTTPATPLHIKSDTPYIRFEDDNDNQDWTIEARAFFGIHDVTDNAFRLVIDGDGNLGIGTTSPNRLIHAAGATPILKLDSTNNEAYVQFVTASPSNTFYIGLVDSDIILQSSGASSTTSENLRIKANGRVGINSASPSGTLSVADPNGDNVTLVLHTSATANYIQLSDSQNAHSYIAKENNGNLSQVSFYASTSTGNGTGKAGHFDYRGLVLPAGKAISFSPHDDPFAQAPNPNNSNRLEDYEEGNFTPAITATGTDPTQSYVHQLGYYVKVGRIVTISVDIIFASSGISGGTDEAVLSNLPFNKANNTNHYGCTMAVGFSPNWGGTSCPTGGYVNPNATFAYLMPYNSNGTEFSLASQVGNGTRLIAGLTYMTN